MAHTIDKKHIAAGNWASIEKESILSQSKIDIEHELKDRNIGDMIFDLKKREKDGTIYKYMWVERFRKALMWMVGLFKTYSKGYIRRSGYNLPNFSAEGIERSIDNGKFNESAHIMWTIAALGAMIWYMNENQDPSWSCIFIFLINFYATILQRYNRGRLLSTLEKKKEPDERKETLTDTLQ